MRAVATRIRSAGSPWNGPGKRLLTSAMTLTARHAGPPPDRAMWAGYFKLETGMVNCTVFTLPSRWNCTHTR